MDVSVLYQSDVDLHVHSLTLVISPTRQYTTTTNNQYSQGIQNQNVASQHYTIQLPFNLEIAKK